MVLGSYSLCFLSGGGLWFSLWLKCSGCGFWFCFLYFWSCSLCFVRRCWSLVLLFCLAVVFVLVLFLFNFGYGYAVAEALRLWSLVLFLLSLLGGVVALLRTRLLFVYFFYFVSTSQRLILCKFHTYLHTFRWSF